MERQWFYLYMFKGYLDEVNSKKLLSKQYFDTEDLGYIKNKTLLVGRNNQIIKEEVFN